MVDTRDKEGSGTAGVEAVGFNLVRRDVGDMIDGGSGMAKFGCVVLGGDIVWPASGVKVAVEGRIWGGVECLEVLNAVA